MRYVDETYLSVREDFVGNMTNGITVVELDDLLIKLIKNLGFVMQNYRGQAYD